MLQCTIFIPFKPLIANRQRLRYPCSMHSLPIPVFMVRMISMATCFAAMLLSIALIPEGFLVISPILLWPVAYVWALFCAVAMPLPLIFFLALLNDVLMGTPLGVMPLATLLLIWQTQKDTRSLKRSFASFWLQFLLHSFAAILLMSAVLSLYQWRLVAIQPVLIQWIFTVLCYPPIHAGLLNGLRAYRLETHE